MPNKGKKRLSARRVRKNSKLKLSPDDELVWADVYERLHNHFKKEAPDARLALDVLVNAGCTENAILQNAYLFCGGDSEQLKLLRESYDFKGQKKRFLRAAVLLTQAVNVIKSTEADLDKLGWKAHCAPDLKALTAYSGFVKRFGEVGFSGLANERISGRDQHLVYLCKMVKWLTGKPHYDEIAELLHATRLLDNPSATEIDTYETVRQRLKRVRGPLIDLVSELEIYEMPSNTEGQS